MLCQGTALLLPLITVHSETPDVFVHRVLISSPLQETKSKKRKFSPADENDSGIEVYYREEEDIYELVDGYHRYLVMKTSVRIYKRENGLLPVTVINKDISNRMASTIRHNRGR